MAKGVEFLKKGQGADGSWTPDGAGHTRQYQEGYTALCLFALIKCGVKRSDPIIVKGFEYIKSKDFRSIYSVSCLVLALDAYYSPSQEPKSEKAKKALQTVPYEKLVRRNWAHPAAKKDLALLRKALDWIISKQQANVWRYPMDAQPNLPAPDKNPEDASNSQYAMLALNVGLRLGLVKDQNIFYKVMDYFVREQDKDGPKFEPPFRVPGADLDIAVLKKLRDKILKQNKKALKKAKRKKEKEKFDQGTSVVDDPYPDFGPEDINMRARGWSYEPRSVQCNAMYHKTSGSMTTSGIAALMICKSAVENTPQWKQYRKKVNQAIRDGCAWIAKNWSVTSNPGFHDHYYYYMYGLERAGVLAVLTRFGEHEWYEEGAKAILSRQGSDGSWKGGYSDGTTANTCFALLFLKKATTAIVKIPEQPWTGDYTDKDKKKK